MCLIVHRFLSNLYDIFGKFSIKINLISLIIDDIKLMFVLAMLQTMNKNRNSLKTQMLLPEMKFHMEFRDYSHVTIPSCDPRPVTISSPPRPYAF